MKNRGRGAFGALILASLSTVAGATDGDLDPAFGARGTVRVDAGYIEERVADLVAAGGNDAWVVMQLGVGLEGSGETNFVVRRLRADGSFDPAYGNGASATVDFGTAYRDEPRRAALQTDGKLVVVGSVGASFNVGTAFGTARLLPDGRLDTSFGERLNAARRGFARLSIAPTYFRDASATDVAIQRDGRIVVAGMSYVPAEVGTTPHLRFTIARYTPAGDLDASFDADGILVQAGSKPGSAERLVGIATRSDGSLPDDDSITVFGDAAGSAALVRRYDRDGVLDATFGNGGTVVLDRTRGLYDARAAVIDPDGRLVILGDGPERGFSFVRLQRDGTPDATFGTNGRTVLKVAASELTSPEAIALLDDGRIVAAGHVVRPIDPGAPNGASERVYVTVRLTPQGLPDTRYGGGSGLRTHDVRGNPLAILPVDAGLLVGGTLREAATGDNNAGVLRLVVDDDVFADGFEAGR